MGETICAICCGREREVTINCPVDCPYLLAAHRYEDEHRREMPADTPLLDVTIPNDIVHTHQQLMTALAFAIAKFGASQPTATDPDVLSAIEAFAETYKTLAAGIYYERQPAGPVARELYAELTTLIQELKHKQAERGASSEMKDRDVFYLQVFLYRMGLLRTNGRPRSHRYIEFLRSQFPDAAELQRQESHIIVP